MPCIILVILRGILHFVIKYRHVFLKYNKYIENIFQILLTQAALCDTLISTYKQEGGFPMSKGQETKREKFVRLAEARTNKIIDMLQLLGNCSNSSAYEYTQQDVDKIFVAIETEVREAKKKFNKIESKKSSRFTLD